MCHRWKCNDDSKKGLMKPLTSGWIYAHVYTECTPLCADTRRHLAHQKVPRPCLRSLRFLRPKMRTLEKMSTRFPLQSPLFLLGLFLRRLVEGRSKCCSRACLFCLISPLAIAAAMAQNVTTAQVQSAHGAQTTETAASR